MSDRKRAKSPSRPTTSALVFGKENNLLAENAVEEVYDQSTYPPPLERTFPK